MSPSACISSLEREVSSLKRMVYSLERRIPENRGVKRSGSPLESPRTRSPGRLLVNDNDLSDGHRYSPWEGFPPSMSGSPPRSSQEDSFTESPLLGGGSDVEHSSNPALPTYAPTSPTWDPDTSSYVDPYVADLVNQSSTVEGFISCGSNAYQAPGHQEGSVLSDSESEVNVTSDGYDVDEEVSLVLRRYLEEEPTDTESHGLPISTSSGQDLNEVHSNHFINPLFNNEGPSDIQENSDPRRELPSEESEDSSRTESGSPPGFPSSTTFRLRHHL